VCPPHFQPQWRGRTTGTNGTERGKSGKNWEKVKNWEKLGNGGKNWEKMGFFFTFVREIERAEGGGKREVGKISQ
jgi:hypothetical protein